MGENYNEGVRQEVKEGGNSIQLADTFLIQPGWRPCTSSITAYFQETHPFPPTIHTDGRGRKFNLSLPHSHLQKCIRSLVVPEPQNLPIIVHWGGKESLQVLHVIYFQSRKSSRQIRDKWKQANSGGFNHQGSRHLQQPHILENKNTKKHL